MKWDDYIVSLDGDYSQIQKNRQLKDLIRNYGVPPHYRSLIWPRITNTFNLHEQNKRVYIAIIKKE